MAEDFKLATYGTITVIAPQTDAARAWVESHVSREGWQPMWPLLFIEHRYVSALLDGIYADGLRTRP